MTLYVGEEHFRGVSAGADKMAFGDQEEKKGEEEKKLDGGWKCKGHADCWL